MMPARCVCVCVCVLFVLFGAGSVCGPPQSINTRAHARATRSRLTESLHLHHALPFCMLLY